MALHSSNNSNRPLKQRAQFGFRGKSSSALRHTRDSKQSNVACVWECFGSEIFGEHLLGERTASVSSELCTFYRSTAIFDRLIRREFSLERAFDQKGFRTRISRNLLCRTIQCDFSVSLCSRPFRTLAAFCVLIVLVLVQRHPRVCYNKDI